MVPEQGTLRRRLERVNNRVPSKMKLKYRLRLLLSTEVGHREGGDGVDGMWTLDQWGADQMRTFRGLGVEENNRNFPLPAYWAYRGCGSSIFS